MLPPLSQCCPLSPGPHGLSCVWLNIIDKVTSILLQEKLTRDSEPRVHKESNTSQAQVLITGMANVFVLIFSFL